MYYDLFIHSSVFLVWAWLFLEVAYSEETGHELVKCTFFFPWYITNHGITVSIYKILSNILQIAYAFQATTSDIWLSIIANF